MGELNMIERYDELIEKEKAYDAIVAKFGSIENAFKAINEEDVLKFYYCESEGKFLVGQRVDTRYYAEVCKTGLNFRWSRHLPWGKHIIAPNTLWKEHTYPSEPKEIDFFDWLQGYIKRIDKTETKDIKTNADRIRNMSDEELAQHILSTPAYETCIGFCKNREDCFNLLDMDTNIPDEWCKQCLLEWLQKEVE